MNNCTSPHHAHFVEKRCICINTVLSLFDKLCFNKICNMQRVGTIFVHSKCASSTD